MTFVGLFYPVIVGFYLVLTSCAVPRKTTPVIEEGCTQNFGQEFPRATQISNQAWVVLVDSLGGDTLEAEGLLALGPAQANNWILLRKGRQAWMEVRDQHNRLHGRMEWQTEIINSGTWQVAMDVLGLVAVYSKEQGRLWVLQPRDGVLRELARKSCLGDKIQLRRCGKRLFLVDNQDAIMVTPYLRSVASCMH